MIEKLEVENVRIFDGADWEFPLSNLTVFCGTNNSGKSTLLKVLLLLRQSMGIGEGYMQEQGMLRFVGSQVDLGSYRSLVSHNETSRDISVTLTIRDRMPTGLIDELTSLTVAQAEATGDDQDGSVPYRLRSTFRFGSVEEEETVLEASTGGPERTHEVVVSHSRALLKEAVYRLTMNDENVLSWKVVYGGLDDDGDRYYDLLLPRPYLDSIERLSRVTAGDRSGHYARVRVEVRDLLPYWMLAQLRSQGEATDADEETEKWTFEPLPFAMFFASKDLQHTLDGVQYIGPLRSPAERYYITPPDVRQALDPSGEFLPHVLRDIGKFESWHVAPGLKGKPRREPLFVALTRWMKYIRTGKELVGEIRDKEIDWDVTRRVLMEIQVRSPLGGELHALADSGFGYSQLLPIVIRGLLAPPDSTLVIEQPELHLNPAIQVRMGEFLVAMALAGKQVLIETHSEHIVNTIRVLAAEDESGKLGSMCEIVYIDVNAEHARPEVHKLSVRRDGTVPEWPRNFFGEAASLTGRLLKAQTRIREQAAKE